MREEWSWKWQIGAVSDAGSAPGVVVNRLLIYQLISVLPFTHDHELCLILKKGLVEPLLQPDEVV